MSIDAFARTPCLNFTGGQLKLTAKISTKSHLGDSIDLSYIEWVSAGLHSHWCDHSVVVGPLDKNEVPISTRFCHTVL